MLLIAIIACRTESDKCYKVLILLTDRTVVLDNYWTGEILK